MKPFVETSRALPLVTIAIAFRSGAACDPPGKVGLARIAARMLKRGTERRGAETIQDDIDRFGSEMGADATASATWVHGEVIRRNLAPFAELLAEVVAKPAFGEEELSRLVREAQAEIIEARDSDRSLANRAFRRFVFEDHPYGRRLSGTTTSLAAITRDDAIAFHRSHFTRENAVVAVSGDIDEREAAALTDEILAKLPEGEPAADVVAEPTAKKGDTSSSSTSLIGPRRRWSSVVSGQAHTTTIISISWSATRSSVGRSLRASRPKFGENAGGPMARRPSSGSTVAGKCSRSGQRLR